MNYEVLHDYDYTWVWNNQFFPGIILLKYLLFSQNIYFNGVKFKCNFITCGYSITSHHIRYKHTLYERCDHNLWPEITNITFCDFHLTWKHVRVRKFKHSNSFFYTHDHGGVAILHVQLFVGVCACMSVYRSRSTLFAFSKHDTQRFGSTQAFVDLFTLPSEYSSIHTINAHACELMTFLNQITLTMTRY